MDKEGGAGRQDPTDDFFGSKLFNLIKTNVEGCLEEKEKKEEKIGGGGREEGEEEEILAGGRTDGRAGGPKNSKVASKTFLHVGMKLRVYKGRKTTAEMSFSC